MYEELTASWFSKDMGRAQVAELTQVADAREWFDGHLDESLKHHTESHQFMFERQVYNGVQQVVMSSKQYAATPEYTIVGNVLRVSWRAVQRLH